MAVGAGVGILIKFTVLASKHSTWTLLGGIIDWRVIGVMGILNIGIHPLK